MAPAVLQRGTVFGAQHDDTYDWWQSEEPKWKWCLVFNAKPLQPDEDVLYFVATSQLTYFRENPNLLTDILILAAGTYPFFPVETAIDFRDLRMVPLAKLLEKGLRIAGLLSAADVARCESIVRQARLLENRAKRDLALLV